MIDSNRTLLNQLPGQIFIANKQSIMKFLNKDMADLFGYAKLERAIDQPYANIPCKISENSAEIFYKATKGISAGAGIMILQSPFINHLNNVSVVATKYNVSFITPYKLVYRGVEGAPPNSYWNIFRGLNAHYAKEGPRLLFKLAAIIYLKPSLDEKYSSRQSNCVFAGTIACAEMFINPADVRRVQRQAGKVGDYSLRNLYNGNSTLRNLMC